MVAMWKRKMHSLPLTSSVQEDLQICEVLLSLKTLVLRRKKRNTLRRKRRNFNSFAFRSINKPQRRGSGHLLPKSCHMKQVPTRKTVQKKSKKKQFLKAAKRKLSSINCFWTDFTLHQLFGAMDVEEIKRTSAVHDFSIQGRLPLIQRQKGWIVEIIPRKDGSREDMYFTHGKTNLQFRSLKQIRAFIRDQLLPH